MCINQPGSFRCSCNSSFALDRNGRTCSRVLLLGSVSSDDESTATISVSVVLGIIIIALLIILVIAFSWYYFTSKQRSQVQRTESPELHVNPSQDQELQTVAGSHSFTITLKHTEDAV